MSQQPGYAPGPNDSNADPAYLDALFADPSKMINTLRNAYREWDTYSRNLAAYVAGTKAGDTNSLDGLAHNLSPSSDTGWYGTAADEFGKQVKAVRDFGLITAANGSSNAKSGGLQAYYETLMSSDEAYQNPDFHGILFEIENELNSCQNMHIELQNTIAAWAVNAANTWGSASGADPNRPPAIQPYTVHVPGLVQTAADHAKDFVACDSALKSFVCTGFTATLTISMNTNQTGHIIYADANGDSFAGDSSGELFDGSNGGNSLRDWLIAQMKPKGTTFQPSYTRLLRAILVPLTTLYTNLGNSLPQAVSDKSLPVLGGQGNTGNGNNNNGGGGGGLPPAGPASPMPKLATGPAGNLPPKTGTAGGPAGGPIGGASGLPKTGAATVPPPYKPVTSPAGYTAPADLSAYKPLTSPADGGGLGGGKLAAFDPAGGLAGAGGLGPSGLGGAAGGGLDAGGIGGANGFGGPGGGFGAEPGGAAGAGAGAAGMAGRGMPMAPMGAGAGGGRDSKERQRKAFLTEDDDVWGADGGEPPAVL